MSLNDLTTTPITDAVDFADLPEQMGGYAPPPQPGPKRFKLSKLSADNFDLIPAANTNGQGDRVKVKFDQSAPFVIVQSTIESEVGDTFTTSLSNTPRKRGKADDAPQASDWDYLNRALKEPNRPTSNKEFADRLIVQSNQAAQFKADVEWSAQCNPKRDAQWKAEDGTLYGANDEAGTPKKGCGARVYQRDLPKVDGKYVDRLVCPTCSAQIRAFANLTRFEE